MANKKISQLIGLGANEDVSGFFLIPVGAGTSTGPYVTKQVTTTQLAEFVCDNFNIGEKSLVVDIGSNVGVLLNCFKNQGMVTIGVDASSNIVINQIIPIEERTSDDNAITSIATNFKEIESIILNNGDDVTIISIPNVESSISIFGRVKQPGNYPVNNMSLKQILDIAGGFDEAIGVRAVSDSVECIVKVRGCREVRFCTWECRGGVS